MHAAVSGVTERERQRDGGRLRCRWRRRETGKQADIQTACNVLAGPGCDCLLLLLLAAQ